MQTQLQVMLDLQEAMNTRVNPEWRQKGFEWYRAIWIECAELMDHYGWKWWKKQQPDNEQVKLELIDIWHFGLSIMLEQGLTAEDIAQQLSAGMASQDDVSLDEFRERLEVFAGDTLSHKTFSLDKFIPLLSAMDISFEELYTGYVGKNVLNFFRQDHGYQDGSYQKEWGGLEDNEHLVEISQSLDGSSADFKDTLYSALSERYQQLCE